MLPARPSSGSPAAATADVRSSLADKDTAFLADVALSIKTESRRAVINARQVANVSRRVALIVDTLRKLPDARPTPQLLNALQSADYLVKHMSRAPVWQDTLRERFTAEDNFTALRDRLRSVWQLHSTEKWEEQDRRAAREDSESNAVQLLQQHNSGRGDNHGSDGVNPWSISHALTVAELLGPAYLHREVPMKSEDERAACSAPPNAPSSIPRTNSSEPLPEPSDVLVPGTSLSVMAREASSIVLHDDRETSRGRPAALSSLTVASSPSGGHSPGTALATEVDVRDFYKRRQLSSWKLRYEDLDRLTTPISESSAADDRELELEAVPSVGDASHEPAVEVASEPSPKSPHGGHTGADKSVVQRFLVRRDFLFNGHAVAVKELSERPGAPISPETVAAFVQDAVVRSRWCHPGLAHHFGSYTEKFVTPARERVLQEEAERAGHRLFSLFPECAVAGGRLPGPTSPHSGAHNNINSSMISGTHSHVFSDTHGTAEDFHRRVTEASFAITSRDAQPTLALGFIVEDVTIQTDRLPRLDDGAAADAGGAHSPAPREEREGASTAPPAVRDAADSAPEYLCLHQLLFVERMRFSLLDSIDVVRQLGGVLQYMLLDRSNVPEEVVTAWLSVAPSNVFVAPVPPPTTPSTPPLPLVSRDPSALVTVDAAASAEMRSAITKESSCAFGVGGGTGSSAASGPLSVVSTTPPPAGGSDRYPTFPMPYVTIAPVRAGAALAVVPDSDGSDDAGPSLLDVSEAAEEVLAARIASVPVPARDSVVVKYAPPACICAGPCSRWQPHPRAVAPATYALAQLFLAMLTGEPPYRHLRRQSELQQKVFAPVVEAPTDDMGVALQVRTGATQGYSLPKTLPLALRVLLTLALSLHPLTPDDYRVESYVAPAVDVMGSDGVTAHEPTTDAANPAAAKAEDDEEDCAALLAALQQSSDNVAKGGRSVFADGDVNSMPQSTSASMMVPRSLSVQMFLEGLSTVTGLLQARHVNRHMGIDLSKDPTYSRDNAGQQSAAQREDGHSTTVEMAELRSPSAHFTAVNPAGNAVDDYGEV